MNHLNKTLPCKKWSLLNTLEKIIYISPTPWLNKLHIEIKDRILIHFNSFDELLWAYHVQSTLLGTIVGIS